MANDGYFYGWRVVGRVPDADYAILDIATHGYVSSQISAIDTIEGDLTIMGNLTVSGATTTLESTTLTVEDNIIVVNKGEPGAGVTLGTAGLEVDRGSLPNPQFLWDEPTDRWDFGVYSVSTSGDVYCEHLYAGADSIYLDGYKFISAPGDGGVPAGNICIGQNTGGSIGAGTGNITLGDGAGQSISTGYGNILIGGTAGSTVSNLFGNVAIGDAALLISTGPFNTAIGYQAGLNYDGAGSTFIGNNAGASETNSNRLHISGWAGSTLIYGEFDNYLVQINGKLEVRGGGDLYVASGNLILPNDHPVNEISTDGTFTDNSDDAIVTEKAIKTYVDTISGVLSNEIDSDITTHAGDGVAHHTRYTDEEAQDAVGNIMSGAGSVTVDYDDVSNTITVSGSVTSGATGWFDDGTNFRVTVTNGIVTNIGATVSGGYSMS
jgi:hypothetical protein